ncbi:MAG: Ppx/GppA phosphatase family [Myxococcaceae bacterium]|nr:Ppx/GppA phosphatase family [Myxococcaceae bacterium]
MRSVAEPNVAGIDIGTNSVRLLITDASGRELVREMRITRLGQGVDVTGSLHPEAIARTTEVLASYRKHLEAHEVTRVRATATSAARDATNSAAFFDAAEQALGHRPELLHGDEEAALSFRGATDGLSSVAAGPYLVIDIGGGSTEFVLGEREPEQLISVNMGCVRMAERHLGSDPPTHDQLEDCFADVRQILQQVRSAVDIARARTVVGLAGTITALAYLQKGLKKYDPAETHRSRLSRAQVEVLFTKLATADLEARRAMLAEPKRAEVIVGGAAVLVTLMRELDIEALLVSESDILDGLAASLR